MSVDPLTKSYPMLTPYQFASNSPILFVDVDGLEGSVDIKFDIMARGYIKGTVTHDELMDFYKSNALGAILGGATLLTSGSALRYGPSIASWLLTNPQAQMSTTAALWGLFLDEEFPIPSPFDDASRTIRSSEKVALEFFGGTESKIVGAINVDKAAKSGVKATIGELFELAEKRDLLGTVDEIFATNPQADFLDEAAGLLKEGGELKITGNYSNPYFRKIWKQIKKGATEIGEFKLKKAVQGVSEELKGQKFYQNDHKTEIPIESLKTIILEKS